MTKNKEIEALVEKIRALSDQVNAATTEADEMRRTYNRRLRDWEPDQHIQYTIDELHRRVRNLEGD